MKKMLILSSFPAPYRVHVFEGLAQKYQADVFFGMKTDATRDQKFYAQSENLNMYVLGNEAADKYFAECISKLKQYDIIVAYDWYLPYAMRVLLRAIVYRIPYVVNCDGAFIKTDQGFNDIIKSNIKRFFIQKAKVCFASGEYAKKYFLHYGAKEQNVKIHNFTSLHKKDILDCVPNDEKKSEYKSRLLLQDKKTVLSIGQFIPRKGYDVLLDAWGDLDTSYELVIIGGGPDKEKYQKIIQEKNYQNVRLIDFMPKEQVMDYYIAADIFVLPTREDIWGLVINEAMACGLPVVTTNMCIAGNEYVQNDLNGYIVPIDNAKELYAAMKKVLFDTELSQKMALENIKLMKECTIERIVESHIDAISIVLGE